jgi:diguanylate cyclase (GGDEF)-like protein
MRSGVTSRLVALILVPVVALLGVAGAVVVSHEATATRAAAVDRGVVRLDDLVALRQALHALWAVEAFDVRFGELGVTRGTAAAFLGLNLDAQVAPARLDAARNLNELGPAAPFPSEDLQSLFRDIEGRKIPAAAAVARLGAYLDASGAAFLDGLAALEAQTRDVRLIAALESLRAANDLVDVAIPQGIDLSAVWFPSPGVTATVAPATLTRFGAETGRYASDIARLRDLGVGTVVATLARIDADPSAQAFERSVASTRAGHPLAPVGAPADPAKIAATFSGYLHRDAMLGGLAGAATGAVQKAARHVASSERDRFDLLLLGTAMLALFCVGVALWLARTISRPLRDLAGYAHSIKEGRLDADALKHLRSDGPRETQMAFDAFSDLVANLRLIDAKANALAHCDFDNPVLVQPLPGRLGQSLESSVAVLSGSIRERDELQTHLAHEATHDALTGISNRPAAVAAVEAALHRAERRGSTTALLFIDLNEFKAVNDSHGHEVGDEVLRQIGARLAGELRRGEHVARLGGDEFVIMVEDIGDAAEAAEVAKRVIEVIGRPIDVGRFGITIGAAVGIALSLDGPEQPLRLLARADAAMYRAKLHEGSAVEIFDAALQQQMVEREDVEGALTTALSDPAGGGLRLEYQPVVDGQSGALASVEALIRWDRPGRGLLTPDSFIPIAEATALIIDLDCWVLDTAARQLMVWSTVPDLRDVPVAVNISGRHLLSGQLAGHIGSVLERTGLPAGRLSIEITETVLLNDLVVAAAELDAVRALGVAVAIDDFGTGYTSLAHLQQLPVDAIKIDRSFVSQLNVRRGSSLVRMVTDLGHAIDLSIVAEGVETSEELAALRAIGADQIQGYFMSRPLRPSALERWVDQRSPGGRPIDLTAAS